MCLPEDFASKGGIYTADTVDHCFSARLGLTACVAVQRGVGLLSERRSRNCGRDSGGADANGQVVNPR